jgi:hypothetical protein
MLEGEGDAFWFHIKCETLTANSTGVVSKTKNQEPLAH